MGALLPKHPTVLRSISGPLILETPVLGGAPAVDADRKSAGSSEARVLIWDVSVGGSLSNLWL